MGLTLDKAQTKLIALANEIPTPPYQVFRKEDEVLQSGLSFPLIVKPVREEASIGIRFDSVVHNLESLKRKVCNILRLYRQPAVVETFVLGREVSVGVIGNDTDLHVLSPLEFLFKGAETPFEQIRSYEYKWGGKQEQMVKAELSRSVIERLGEYTKSMFTATECRDYARMDFRIREDGEVFLLEVNYNPGIGPNTHGLNNTLTKMASFEGCGFEDLVERILVAAMRRERLM